MTPVDLVIERIPAEEGFRQFAYDDATGQRVKAPVGNLTWLYGCNLETEGTQELGLLIVRYGLDQRHARLMAYDWYSTLDVPRQSALLDMAYNMGVEGLLHYPHMIAFISGRDWESAANEMHVRQTAVDNSRYEKLRAIIRTGVA